MTILEEIYRHSINTPDKVAIYDGEFTLSYKELWNEILSAYSYYREIGNPGDRIMLAANKSKGFVISYFGAQLARFITVPIDSETNSERLKLIVQSTSPIGVFGNLEHNDNIVSSCSFFDFNNITNNDSLDFSFPEENDYADILFTTGTTGKPKGVVLSHFNEYHTARMINEFVGNDENDVELLALPVSHSFGLGRLRCVLLKGGTVDLLGSFANMSRFFKEIERRKISGFGMVPASWNYIMKMSGIKIKDYGAQIKYIEIGSAPMNVNDKELLMSLLPKTRICMHYGLTEASRSMFINFNMERDHLNCIGRPSPGVQAVIVNEKNESAKINEEGEICIKGENVCCDYWGEYEKEYNNSFWEDYFKTGDWGYLDEDGYYHLVSRKKELINVGGKKVSPIEIEKIINTIEGVEDSACIGIEDEVLGETVKAYVVRNDYSIDENYIIGLVSEKVEAYKVPKCVEFIERIPKTTSGKIQRLMLK